MVKGGGTQTQTLRASSKDPTIPETQSNETHSLGTTAKPYVIPTISKWDGLSMKQLRECAAEAAEAQKKRKLIEYLRDVDAGKNPSLDPTLLQESSERADDSKRQRGSIWGEIQLPTPSFRGKSWMELQRYLTHLSTMFDMEPDQFKEDAQKIRLASLYLQGDMKSRWTLYWLQECNQSYANLTYDDYAKWCEDNISSADVRALDATAKLDRMRQRDGEKFQRFLRRFEAVHNELSGRLPDILRSAWVIQKCLPEVKKNILSQVLSQGMPASRQQLCSYGTIAELMLEQPSNKSEDQWNSASSTMSETDQSSS